MNVKIGIISGAGMELQGKKITVNTPYGQPSSKIIISENNIAFLERHNKDNPIPPHKINYKANIFALKELGVKNIFGFYSVGSLKQNIKPGQSLVPDDYIGFDIISFFDNKAEHITPEISPDSRNTLITILEKLNIKFHKNGVYFETKGPRLETKAEIKMIQSFADVVGMTMAKEACLAQELGIKFAGLCSIDNFAHGIANEQPTQEQIKQAKTKNQQILQKIISDLQLE